MNKKEITTRKYTGTTDPKEANIATSVYKNKKKVVQVRKRRHRCEALETIFKENELQWNIDDPRIDEEEDISSSDEEIYNPDYERDYMLK